MVVFIQFENCYPVHFPWCWRAYKSVASCFVWMWNMVSYCGGRT